MYSNTTMPVNYADAKIYKIEPKCAHDEDDVYYGSTCRVRLCDRYKGHLSGYKQKKYTTSHLIFDKYKVENCHIVLVEAYPCENRDQITARESHYIRTLPCINKITPNRSEDERKEHKKEYYLENKPNIQDKHKQYYLAHIDKCKENAKQYYLENKEELHAKNKIYNLDNKVSIALTRKIYNEKNKVSLALKRKNRYESNKINKFC